MSIPSAEAGATWEPNESPVNSRQGRASLTSDKGIGHPHRKFHSFAQQRHRSSKGEAINTKPDLPIVPFASRNAWGAFLEGQHATSEGLWLKIAKKGSGIESVTYDQAVEVALCYGWIDGQVRKFDEDYYLQRFTPRRSRSKWSKVNCKKVAELIERGEMKAAGMREVERAKADGRWDAAYDSPSTATVPEDLQRELERNERARKYFSELDARNRYAILYQIQDAKRPGTRAKRIANYVAMLAEQKKPYP
jgi:uncharacterized protein YdeI (YjbR/CyaY-like superfamily)